MDYQGEFSGPQIDARLTLAGSAYQKPETGIPASDLAEGVQESLQKGNSAYQKPVDGIPASDLAEGVIPDVSQFITRTVNDLANYYLKSETYTKAEVQALIDAIKQFTYQTAPSLPTASADTMHIIYLVPSSDPQAQNVKDEYITIDNGAEAQTRYTWEQIGSTAIDLSGYVTTTALNTALADYTTTTDLTILLASKQDVISDLATIRSGAEAGATAYQKPSGGIPASDMASGVQTLLGKADTAVQPAALQAITDLIPSQASSENQLADKAFVNSSIETNTATFQGTYNLVSDLSLTTSATEQQIAAAIATKLASLTPPKVADKNDYVFVQIPTADATPTEIARVDRYKYEGTAWGYEWSLNNSSFTAAQWAAINSGITSALVTKLDGIASGAQVNVIETVKVNNTALTPVSKAVNIDISGKEDTANKVNSISSSSTDTQYPSAKAVYDFVSAAIGGAIDETYPQNE